MIVLIHVLTAIASMAYTSYLFFRPSKGGLRTAYGLVGATLISGTYLVVSLNAQLLSACITGLIYLGAVTIGLVLANRRLAVETKNK